MTALCIVEMIQSCHTADFHKYYPFADPIPHIIWSFTVLRQLFQWPQLNIRGKLQCRGSCRLKHAPSGMGGVDSLSAYNCPTKKWGGAYVPAVVAAKELHCHYSEPAAAISHFELHRRLTLGLLRGIFRHTGTLRLGGPCHGNHRFPI